MANPNAPEESLQAAQLLFPRKRRGMLDNKLRRAYGMPPAPSSQTALSPMLYGLERLYNGFDDHMSETIESAPIGFLSVLDLSSTGYCGGLLVLNQRGRPAEFHCNSPIRPNRTQEILYGPTLRPFVMAESIAMNLIEKCSRRPGAILTDLAELWELSSQLTIPLALVPSGQPSENNPESPRPPEPWRWIEIAGQVVGLPSGEEARRTALEQSVISFAQYLPLAEPFQRIHNAIEEAHRNTPWRESA